MSKQKSATVSSPSLSEICSSKKIIRAKNPEQKEMMSIIAHNNIVLVKGAPGTGKTLLAVNYAIEKFGQKNSKIERIVFTRPVIEAGGEKLGFLPGDMYDKIDPYIMPLMESLSQLVPIDMVKKLTCKNGKDPVIRILPLAYMRGLTFSNCIIVCDEMQNSTPEQIRMLLTRLGENSKIIICGDVRQSDIHGVNGLEDAFGLLQDIEGIGFVTLTQQAIVRHPIIIKIEERYEARTKAKLEARNRGESRHG